MIFPKKCGFTSSSTSLNTLELSNSFKFKELVENDTGRHATSPKSNKWGEFTSMQLKEYYDKGYEENSQLLHPTAKWGCSKDESHNYGNGSLHDTE